MNTYTESKNSLNNKPISMVMVPQEEWTQLNKTVIEVKDLLKSFQSNASEEWLSLDKVQEILGVSQRSILRYRNERIIPFVQIGRKIFVKRRDLDEFIQSYYIPTRA